MKVLNIIKKIILLLMRVYFRLLTKVIIKKNGVEELNEPYLILGNHTNYWDPFLISAFLNQHVYFVASIEYFKKASTRYFLKIAGAIPKTKFMKDTSTIKKILTLKKNQRIIGIFPEGMRSWDGKTQGIIFSTAKLIKLLRIPVVLTTIKGAHLNKPRWAKYRRKGKIELSFQILLGKDEIKSMSAEEVYQYLVKNFAYDEYQHQRQVMAPYPGRDLAENLELFIFTCPHCKSFDTMASKGNKFYCQKCGYSTMLNRYGFLESSQFLYFDNPRDWNEWQLDHLQTYLQEGYKEAADTETVILEEKQSILFIDQNGNWQNFLQGSVSMTVHSLIFSTGKIKKDFILDQIQALNIHSARYIEFYYEHIRYRFNLLEEKLSAYKWVKAIEIMTSMKESEALFK